MEERVLAMERREPIPAVARRPAAGHPLERPPLKVVELAAAQSVEAQGVPISESRTASPDSDGPHVRIVARGDKIYKTELKKTKPKAKRRVKAKKTKAKAKKNKAKAKTPVKSKPRPPAQSTSEASQPPTPRPRAASAPSASSKE